MTSICSINSRLIKLWKRIIHQNVQYTIAILDASRTVFGYHRVLDYLNAMSLISLLKIAVEKNASDLHLSSDEVPFLRIQGDLIRLPDQLVWRHDAIQKNIYEFISKIQQKKFEEEKELDFAFAIPDLAQFRVNLFQQARGMSAVFRLIPKKIPTLDDLEAPAIFKKILAHQNGLILVTGPTGSGKSTTLAGMLDHLNKNSASHIITIEDPIEFVHESKNSLIQQRELHRDTHQFSAALRGALREDPDVIMVGELRDLETIRLALTAAETGHLVLATLHTASAPKTITRIIDVFPAHEKNIIKNILSESLQAVICQTLVKTNSGSRTAAFEIMICNNAIRNLIREEKISQIYSVMQTGMSAGMCTMEHYLQELNRKNIISQAVC